MNDLYRCNNPMTSLIFLKRSANFPHDITLYTFKCMFNLTKQTSVKIDIIYKSKFNLGFTVGQNKDVVKEICL